MPDVPSSPENAFDLLRERGVHRRDPVRFRLAEALARRAAAHSGAARHVLDDKLAALIARLTRAPDVAPAGPPPRVTRGALLTRGPLAELVEDVSRQKPAPVLDLAVAPCEAHADKPGAPPTLHFFKRTWSRLSADQRLVQSRASLPDNAGPLNSHHLVHRSLTLMRELSPEYLEHFVGYVDALQWVEQANEAAAAEAAAGPRRNAALRRG
jgi:hypothetical protein